jgi:hypothetical protein
METNTILLACIAGILTIIAVLKIVSLVATASYWEWVKAAHGKHRDRQVLINEHLGRIFGILKDRMEPQLRTIENIYEATEGEALRERKRQRRDMQDLAAFRGNKVKFQAANTKKAAEQDRALIERALRDGTLLNPEDPTRPAGTIPWEAQYCHGITCNTYLSTCEGFLFAGPPFDKWNHGAYLCRGCTLKILRQKYGV